MKFAVVLIFLALGHMQAKTISPQKVARSACGATSQVSSSDAATLLKQHINFRKGEQSSNMNAMTYAADLADRAQELVNTCHYEHGLTKDCDGKGIGQNLYVSWGGSSLPSSFDPERVVYRWADNEKPSYNYTTGSCSYVCGHYTQVAWAKTSEVGCGVQYCPVVTHTVTDENGDDVPAEFQKNARLVACNYRQAGNSGNKPFLMGDACTKCKFNTWESGWKCADQQCVACDLADDGCNCPAETCEHGTSTETYTDGQCTSTCSCDTGYWGEGCNKPCDCTSVSNTMADATCERYAGWGFCTNQNARFMNYYCAGACACPDPNNLPATCVTTD